MSQVRQGCNIYDMTFTCQGYCEKSAIGNPNQSSGHAGIILIYLSLLLDCKRAQRFSSPRHQVTTCISINVSGRSRFGWRGKFDMFPSILSLFLCWNLEGAKVCSQSGWGAWPDLLPLDLPWLMFKPIIMLNESTLQELFKNTEAQWCNCSLHLLWFKISCSILDETCLSSNGSFFYWNVERVHDDFSDDRIPMSQYNIAPMMISHLLTYHPTACNLKAEV